MIQWMMQNTINKSGFENEIKIERLKIREFIGMKDVKRDSPSALLESMKKMGITEINNYLKK